jgi:uncharacterized membrane protein YgcG
MLWILAAVAGVLLVAGITAAASSLSSQTIGLSSEPLTAGDQLTARATATATATPKARKKKRKHDDRGAARPRASATPVATVDDHGGGSDDPIASDDNSGHGGGDDSSGSGSSGSGSGDDSSGHGGDDD